ncbi:MAG TPA: DHA2 family efflux MFS transporter permease subunit [Jatrophihabitans sp.]
MTDATDSRRWLALGVLCFSVLLVSLDQTVLNVALPTLIGDLHPSASGLPWIADSYTLASAVLIIIGGALGDRFGRRRIFLLGVAVFGVSSLACALSHDTGMVIAARGAMGLGAALLMPATLSIIAMTFEGAQRLRAIGIWAGVSGIGTAAGPLLGGWLLQHYWWGSVFLINVPIAVAALIAGYLVIRESRAPHDVPLDILGVVLSSLGLAAITYGLIVAPDHGWGSVQALAPLLGGVALVVVFVFWERRCSTPLIDLHLFGNRTFSSALGAVTAIFFVMFGVSYLFSQFIQFAQGHDSFGVGLRFLPLAIGTLISANLAPRITHKLGLRAVMVVGMVMIVVSLVLLAEMQADSSDWLLIASFGLIGLGMGLVIAPASSAIIGTLPPAKVGAGSGLRSMVQLLGGSFGVAIIGSLATQRYRAHINHDLNTTLQGLPPAARTQVADQIGHAVAVAKTLPPDLAKATTTAASNAFVSGMHLDAIVGAAVMVVATIVAAIFIPQRVEHAMLPAPLEPGPVEAAEALS